MKSLFELLAGLLSVLFLGFSAFLVNVLLHELGHAIPRLLWSKKKVAIFVGSMGDINHSFRLTMGRLDLYLKYNPFLWRGGLCRSDERLPVKKAIFCTIMGPLVSLLLTAIPFVLLKTTEPDRQQTIVLVTFMVTAGVFTLASAIPRGHLTRTFSGGGVRNDATQIIQLWKTRQLPSAYWEAMDKLAAKRYPEAAELLDNITDNGYSSAALYRTAVIAHFYAGQYERAQVLQELIRERYRLSLDDKINDGCLLLMRGRYREAASLFRELASLHNNHFLILNNTGYALILAGQAKDALLYLDTGITRAPRYAELYANRAWAKMEQGQWNEGLADAEQALKLNASSPGAYQALGLYAREKGELQTAKEYFLKALSFQQGMPFIEEQLADIERRLETVAGAGV